MARDLPHARLERVFREKIDEEVVDLPFDRRERSARRVHLGAGHHLPQAALRSGDTCDGPVAAEDQHHVEDAR